MSQNERVRPLSEEEKTRRRERERERRRNLSEEQRRLERERKRECRRNMTEESRENERQRQRLLRQNFTEENRENERQRQRLLRENFTEENRESERQRQRLLRENFTEENRESERQRQRLLRGSFTEENRESERQRKRVSREKFTEESKERELQKKRDWREKLSDLEKEKNCTEGKRRKTSDDELVESVFKDSDDSDDDQDISCKSLVAQGAADIEPSEDFYQECSSSEGCSAANVEVEDDENDKLHEEVENNEIDELNREVILIHGGNNQCDCINEELVEEISCDGNPGIDFQEDFQDNIQNEEPEEQIPQINDREDAELIARARAVGIAYEFARPGVTENINEKRRRRRRNQRKISKEERRLREVIGDLPPPPPPGSSKHEDDCYLAIRAFEIEQMTYDFVLCDTCKERRLQVICSRNGCCSRCKRDKQVPKMWSQENNMDPGPVPDQLADLTDAEQMLIARLAPAIHVRMLKHGGIASRGHCIAFPQAVQEPATILPRLPAEVDIIRVRRQGKDDTHKDFRVRRYRVEAALRWLRAHNIAYSNIVIDEVRIEELPEDGELPLLRTVEFSETHHEDDRGPAPDQLDVGVVDGDEETVSGVLLPEPGVNVQEQIETAVNQIISDHEDDQRVNQPATVQRLVIPWPTTERTPVSEFTTPYFFSMAFPCLFPTGCSDYNANRPRTCSSLHDWAEHLLWYQDGRFAKNKVWKFVVHNMIMRKRALEQSRYFVDQQLGEPHITVADLQERIARGDTSIANRLLYFGASLRGTSQYWHQRRRELRALIEFMVNERLGLPSFFMTGSCAEFYFPPLRRLLEKYILQTTGDVVNLLEDNNARFKAVQENTHVVVSYFDARTQSYHEKIVRGVFGVSDYWYRYEFAKSRGQIHWHQLSWRGDREPHELLNSAREEECNEDEYVSRLSDWVQEKFAMSASHPAGQDEDGTPKKEFWPPPEGTADPITNNRDPLVKMLMDVSETQDAILEDYLQLINRVGLHCCSDYCLRTPRHPQPGLQPAERVCRMEFGSEFNRGKEPRDSPAIVTDRNGALRLELPRDHPRVVQHSRYQLQSWRANGDVSLIVSNSHPDNPSANEIIAVTDYVCGYACKDNEPTGATIDLFKDMVNTTEAGDETSGRSVCAKLLMKTVGRRDISGPEASFELSNLALWHCSRQFTYLSMTGSRRLERNGDTATTNTSLDKYLARPRGRLCSWYEYASSNGKVPVVSGGATHATWPLNEDYCRTMMLLHWPSWYHMREVKSDGESWIERFEEFLESDDCPTFVKAQVLKAQQTANYQRENEYEEDEENEAEDAEEQPEWVDVYAGHNHHYEGVESEFQFDDGGDQYDWSSTSVPIDAQEAKHWLENCIQVNDERNEVDNSVELPEVCPSTLNEEQRSIVSLVLFTLYNMLENPDDYSPLRLIVSGTGGTGKSYVIKCLQRLVRQVFERNNAIQVITPTGNSAYLVEGRTAHSFLSLPAGGRSCSELSRPSGSVLERIQNRCENLKVLIGDERSMFGRTTMGWMEQHTRYGVNRGNSSEELWGGIPAVVMMGDDVQLPPVCDTPVYVPDARSAPSNHGRLVWTNFDSAVELTQIVRQSESELQLRDVLMSMRTYTTTSDQVRWLQQFQWHNLERTHGEGLLQRMDEHGLFVFPTHRLEWERNKSKLLECNHLPDHPVAKIKAVNNGKHAQKAESNKAGGLLQLLYLCRDSKVMLVANLKAEWGLYNGAVGTVVNVIYLNGRRPTDDPQPQPDVVLVRFNGYRGPAFIDDHPTIVPIVPISRSIECACRCKRIQIPLRLAWGTTIHKCQGMTVGEGEAFRYVVIHPGNHAFEAKNPGALFVALSRAKSAGGPDRDPDFAFHQDVLINEDRFREVNTPTTRSRAAEIERLRRLSVECRGRESLARAYEELTFERLLNWAQSRAVS